MSAPATIRRLVATPAAGPVLDLILRRFESFLPHLAWHVVIDARVGRRNAAACRRLLRRMEREQARGRLMPRTILRASRDAPPVPARGVAGCARAVIVEDPALENWARAAAPGAGLALFRICAGSSFVRRGLVALLERHPCAAAWIAAAGPPRGRAAAGIARMPEPLLERVFWSAGRRVWYRSDGRWSCDRTLFAAGAAGVTVTLGAAGLTVERHGRRAHRIPAGSAWLRRLSAALEEEP